MVVSQDYRHMSLRSLALRAQRVAKVFASPSTWSRLVRERGWPAIPHSAFAGQTPDEMYFGRGDQVPADLAAERARAREARMKSNRALSCEACRPPIREKAGTSDFSAISGALQMHDEMSAMS
jgi:hypothetical protein